MQNYENNSNQSCKINQIADNIDIYFKLKQNTKNLILSKYALEEEQLRKQIPKDINIKL